MHEIYSLHTMNPTKILFFISMMLFSAASFSEVVVAQSKPPSYRYNRIAVDLTILENGDVRVQQPLTMLYNGIYHSMWQTIPVATTTLVTDIEVLDGSTGQPLMFSSERLDATTPESWGKYTTYVLENGSHAVEWYYNTPNRVHTWVLRYTVRGAVTLSSDHDELLWTLFANYDVPVDTVEVEVHVPREITLPRSDMYTTGGHDYYIDRPDAKTFRFRVSDIAQGERVFIRAGWQKGLIHPPLALPLVLWIGSHATLLIGIAQLTIGIGVVAYLARTQRERLRRHFQKIGASVSATKERAKGRFLHLMKLWKP